MTNPKALAVTRRAQLATTLIENPEITAMAAICEILQELPDDASRLRVMRWAFGRFNEEFKRPVATPPPAPAPGPRLVAVPPPASAPAPAPATPRLAADDGDFGRQISELQDMFPDERQADRLIDDRSAFTDLF